MRWVVFQEREVDRVEAVDKPAAEAIATRRYGEGTRVQSEVSRQIELEERAEISRNREIKRWGGNS